MHPARVKRATSRYRLDQGFGQAFTLNKKSPQYPGLVFSVPFARGPAGGISSYIDNLAMTKGDNPVWVNDGKRGWAMLFDDANSQYLATSPKKAVVTDVPYTFSAWINWDDDGATGPIISVGDEGDGNNQTYLYVQGTSVIMRRHWEGAIEAAVATAGITQDNWHHICGMFYDDTNIAAFVDGANKGTESIQRNHPIDFDITYIGRRMNASWFASGKIADARIYNRALSDQEVYGLYANPWDLFKVRQTAVWASTLGVARIPRIPATYNTLQIY